MEVKRVDGEDSRIVYHRKVYSHHSSSKSIPTTNQEAQTHANSSMQMTSVLLRRIMTSAPLKNNSPMLSINWHHTMKRTMYVQIHQKVYLGITLDCCFSFTTYIEKTKAKVCARNNIVSNLTGTNWGASSSTLRSTAVSLLPLNCWVCMPSLGKITPR